MGRNNKPSAWRKAIFNLYIWVRHRYIKPGQDTFFNLLGLIGDLLLFAGTVLLLYDWLVLDPLIFCLPCQFHGLGSIYGDLSTFMANYQCSHMNQVWFTCFYLGVGFNALNICVGKL